MSELPTDWQLRPIDTVASRVTAGATPESGSERYYVPAGGLPFAKIDDLTRATDRFLRTTELHVSDAALTQTALKRYPVGTILISMYGTIGLVKTTAVELCANQALSALLPPFACDDDYLAHALAALRPSWEKYKSQTTQANINGAVVKAFEVPMPPLAEQQRIAEILDTLDVAIRKTEEVIGKLQQVKQGLLHDLLTRGIDEYGELRDPDRRPEQFKDSELGTVPRDWAVHSLGGLLLGTPSNGIYKPASLIGRGTLLVGQTAVDEERRLDFALARRAVTSADDRQRFGLAEGDILLSRVFATLAGVGLPSLVPHVPEPAVFESNMMRLRANRALILPRLLFEALRTRAARRHIENHANASNQASVNQAALGPLPVACPPLAEQKRAEELIRALHEQVDREAARRSKLSNIKSALMHDLLTGRVRVLPNMPAFVENQWTTRAGK